MPMIAHRPAAPNLSALKFSALVLTFLGVLVQPAVAQSLNQALISTYGSNATIRSGQAQALQSIETYNQVVAATKLQATASLTAGTSSSDNYQGSGLDATLDTAEASINLSQNLFQGSFDGIPAGVRQSLGGVSSAQETYKTTEMNTLFQAVGTYMSVLGDQGALGVAASGVSTADQQLEAAQARLDAGEGTRTDVALAESGLAQARANLALAQATLNSSRASFTQVIGRTPQALSDPGFPRLPRSLNAAIAQAMESSPLIKAAEIGVQVAEDTVITTRAQNGLNIAATGSLSRSWSETLNGSTDNNSYFIGITASIPLMDGGTRSAVVTSAQQGVVIAQAALEDQQAAVRAQVTAAWGSAQAQFANLNALITVTNAQELVLEATRAEFDAGSATFLQVQNAQQDFEEAQNQYVRAKSDAVVASYNVLLAMGAMTTEKLGLDVLHFDAVDLLDERRNRTYAQMLRRR